MEDKPKREGGDSRKRAVRICQGEEPLPNHRSDIAFLVRKAKAKKDDGDKLFKQISELEAALGLMKEEILKAQGAVDNSIDMIAELLEDEGSNSSEDPPPEPAGDSSEPL